MPETNKYQEPRRQEPNWVDVGTFLVLAATLIVVSIYTCEAHRQNELTREAITTQTRPYLRVAIKPETFSLSKTPPTAGRNDRTMSIQFSVANGGKLPGYARIQAGIVWESQHRGREPNTPQPTTNLGSRFIFPDQDNGLLTAYSKNLTPGDIEDLRVDAHGKLFAVVQVYYGPDDHLATAYPLQVCLVYPFEVAGDAQQGKIDGEGEPCPGEEMNYAK